MQQNPDDQVPADKLENAPGSAAEWAQEDNEDPIPVEKLTEKADPYYWATLDDLLPIPTNKLVNAVDEVARELAKDAGGLQCWRLIRLHKHCSMLKPR